MLDAAIAYIKKTIVNPAEQTIVMTQSAREDVTNELAERIRMEIGPKDIMFVPLGRACGASIGPGLCVAMYFGTERTAGCVREKEILSEILSAK